MVFKKISELILSKSNSYQFYKGKYEKLEKTNGEYLEEINRLKNENRKQKDEIDRLKNDNKTKNDEINRLIANDSLKSENDKDNELNNSLKNEIETLKSSCSKYEEDNAYLKSLLKYEIESIEKYMFELVERGNNQKKE